MFLKPTKPMSRSMQFLSGFGLIALFGGGLFLLDGAWQSYNQYIQRTRWPAVEAHVSKCSIYTSWYYAGSPSSKHAWREDSYIRCKLNYIAGGIARESVTKMGDSIVAYGQHRRYFAPDLTVTKMLDWIGRHPAGAVLTIHYDPTDPNNISPAESDKELRISLPSERLWFGVVASGCGLALMLIGKMARNHFAHGDTRFDEIG